MLVLKRSLTAARPDTDLPCQDVQETVPRLTESASFITPARMMIQGPDLFDKTSVLVRGDPSRTEGEATPGYLSAVSRAD